MQTLFYVVDKKNNPKPHSVSLALVYCKHPFWHMEECYIYVCTYIYMFAKLHFVGYYLSTSTSQEKEHSSMQKYENKDVYVKHGLGVTAVPSQPAPTGTSCSQGQQGPLAASGQCQAGVTAPSAEEGVLAACSTPPTPRDVSQLLPGRAGSGLNTCVAFCSLFGWGLLSGWWSLSYCCEMLDSSGFIQSPVAVWASCPCASGVQGIAPDGWRGSGEGAALHWPRGCLSLWSMGGTSGMCHNSTYEGLLLNPITASFFLLRD